MEIARRRPRIEEVTSKRHVYRKHVYCQPTPRAELSLPTSCVPPCFMCTIRVKPPLPNGVCTGICHVYHQSQAAPFKWYVYRQQGKPQIAKGAAQRSGHEHVGRRCCGEKWSQKRQTLKRKGDARLVPTTLGEWTWTTLWLFVRCDYNQQDHTAASRYSKAATDFVYTTQLMRWPVIKKVSWQQTCGRRQQLRTVD